MIFVVERSTSLATPTAQHHQSQSNPFKMIGHCSTEIILVTWIEFVAKVEHCVKEIEMTRDDDDDDDDDHDEDDHDDDDDEDMQSDPIFWSPGDFWKTSTSKDISTDPTFNTDGDKFWYLIFCFHLMEPNC